jgi:hypothetical protein
MTDQSAELIGKDKHQRLRSLELDLVAAASGPKVDIDMAELKNKGLVAVLRGKLKSRRPTTNDRRRKAKPTHP